MQRLHFGALGKGMEPRLIAIKTVSKNDKSAVHPWNNGILKIAFQRLALIREHVNWFYRTLDNSY